MMELFGENSSRLLVNCFIVDFDWVLNTSLLFTMNREKRIALGKVVWRYPVF